MIFTEKHSQITAARPGICRSPKLIIPWLVKILNTIVCRSDSDVLQWVHGSWCRHKHPYRNPTRQSDPWRQKLQTLTKRRIHPLLQNCPRWVWYTAQHNRRQHCLLQLYLRRDNCRIEQCQDITCFPSRVPLQVHFPEICCSICSELFSKEEGSLQHSMWVLIYLCLSSGYEIGILINTSTWIPVLNVCNSYMTLYFFVCLLFLFACVFSVCFLFVDILWVLGDLSLFR